MVKRILIVLVIAIIIASAFTTMHFESNAATMPISKADLYSKGEVVFFNYDNIGIGVEVIVYKKDGVEYPAYCINKGRPGVTEEHEYSVSINKLVTNNKIWKAIVNGYPFKTPQELGCNNMQEAYAATKMAVYDAMYNYDLDKFTVHGDVDSNRRVVAAIKKIITAARSSTDSKKVATITVKDESKEWKVDSIDKNYLSKTYSVTASAANETYTISLENDTKKIAKVVDVNNKERTTFNANEKFKVLLPIVELEEKGSFTIKASSELKTMPILYGETPNPEWQNFAVTAGFFEPTDVKLNQSYSPNYNKIQIIKKDGKRENTLKGGIFKKKKKKNNVLYTDLTTNEEGKIVIENLIPGKYYLEEIVAPEGYSKLEDRVEIDLKLNQTYKVTVNNFEKPEDEDKVVPEEDEITVGEEEKYLPRTGY
mgnify:CR=1 FL=1